MKNILIGIFILLMLLILVPPIIFLLMIYVNWLAKCLGIY